MASNGTTPQQRNDGIVLESLAALRAGGGGRSAAAGDVSVSLGQARQEDLAQHWIIAAMCSAYPDEATRNGWEVTLSESEDPGVVRAFDTYRSVIGGETEDEELISDLEIFAQAGYLANVHGGAAIVIGADDGQPPFEPIKTDRIKTIRFLEVMDRYEITPVLDRTNNPFRATHYRLTMPPLSRGLRSSEQADRLGSMFGDKKAIGAESFLIHRSRVLRIPGQRVPRRVMVERYQGWDQSLIDRVYEAFTDWRSIGKDVRNLIRDYSLFVYALDGLQEMISEGNQERLTKRFQALREMVSVLGGAAVDSEKEKIEFIQRQFAGIPDLVDRWRDVLIGASGLPHTVLFGESPSGLGATGESEEKTWAKQAGQYQRRVIAPRLRRLFRLIWLAKDGPTGGQEPEGWGIRFHPLLEESESEKVGNLSTFVGTLSAAINGGFLLADEARSPFSAAAPSFNITLDPEKWEEQQQKDNQGFDFGFGAEPAAASDPAAEDPATGEAEPTEDTPERQDGWRQDAEFGDADLHAQAKAEAKRRFKVYPSAYANGWMVRRYRELYRERHGSLEGAFEGKKSKALSRSARSVGK